MASSIFGTNYSDVTNLIIGVNWMPYAIDAGSFGDDGTDTPAYYTFTANGYGYRMEASSITGLITILPGNE